MPPHELKAPEPGPSLPDGECEKPTANSFRGTGGEVRSHFRRGEHRCRRVQGAAGGLPAMIASSTKTNTHCTSLRYDIIRYAMGWDGMGWDGNGMGMGWDAEKALESRVGCRKGTEEYRDQACLKTGTSNTSKYSPGVWSDWLPGHWPSSLERTREVQWVSLSTSRTSDLFESSLSPMFEPRSLGPCLVLLGSTASADPSHRDGHGLPDQPPVEVPEEALSQRLFSAVANARQTDSTGDPS